MFSHDPTDRPALTLCPCCGDRLGALRDRAELSDEAARLADVAIGSEACRWCARRLEADVDELALEEAAEVDAILAEDLDFQSVCDARRDAWVMAMESDFAALAPVVRVSHDLTAAVSL